MATLSVGREEMYTQPVSAERILAIGPRFASAAVTRFAHVNYRYIIGFHVARLLCVALVLQLQHTAYNNLLREGMRERC